MTAQNAGSAPHTAPPGQWRLLAPACAAWAAVALGAGAPGTATWVLAGAGTVGGLVAIAAVLRVRMGQAIRYVAVACALLAVLSARMVVMEAARDAPELASAAEHRSVIELEARVTGYPERTETPFSESGWVRAEVRGSLGAVPVLLWLQEPPPRSWAPGTRLDVSGRLDRLEPASVDAYGVSVVAVAESTPGSLAEQVERAMGEGAVSLRYGLRDAAADVDGAALVPGFAVGDVSDVPDDTDARMRDTSLTHLTAVSGANCALVISAVVAVASRCGAGRRTRIALAAAGLGGFVLVVGPDASVQRAAVMAAAVLVSDFGGKRRAALPALACAIIVLLCADPWQSRAPGFTLSVAATGGILLLVPSIERWLRRARFPRALALPVAVAAAAQFSCGPILLTLQDGIPAVGILANVLAAPAAPIGTGVGLLALLLIPIWPDAGHACVVLASWATQWVEATASVTAALPLGRWHWPGGAVGALALALCQAALLLAWAVRSGTVPVPGAEIPPRAHPWQPRHHPPRLVRTTVAVLASASLGTVIAVIIVTPVAERVATPAEWSLVACDVGQGDALLVRDPAAPDAVMLVDTGDDPEKLETCLERFAVTRIGTLVLTHDDRDHVGALEVAAPIADTAVVAPPTREQDATGVRDVTANLDAAGVPWRIGTAGQVSDPAADGPEWRVLAPADGPLPAEKNAASVVMHVTAGELTILMLGDTGEPEHRALLATGTDVSADVLKVAHHGSGDQDPALVEATRADVGVISVGADNGYGHPHPDVLDALERAGTRALRTDLSGAIAISAGSAGAGAADSSSPPEVWVERSVPETG